MAGNLGLHLVGRFRVVRLMLSCKYLEDGFCSPTGNIWESQDLLSRESHMAKKADNVQKSYNLSV